MLLHKNYCPLKASQIFVEGNFPDEKGRTAIRQDHFESGSVSG